MRGRGAEEQRSRGEEAQSELPIFSPLRLCPSSPLPLFSSALLHLLKPCPTNSLLLSDIFAPNANK